MLLNSFRTEFEKLACSSGPLLKILYFRLKSVQSVNLNHTPVGITFGKTEMYADTFCFTVAAIFKPPVEKSSK